MDILGGSGAQLKTKGGEVTVGEALGNVKVVGLYFSGHFCPPCKAFTPVLAELYNEVNASGKVLEIVFVSCDHSMGDYTTYFATMPWLAIQQGDPRVNTIASKFSVSGIPRLVILKPDGTVIAQDARGKVQSEGPAAVEEWLKA